MPDAGTQQSADEGRPATARLASPEPEPATNAPIMEGVSVVLAGRPRGMRVDAARALQRACGNRRFARILARLTAGEVAFNSARTWLDQDASVKADTDVLHVALREIKANKSVTFNRDAGRQRLASALTTLGRDPDLATVEAEWAWLVDHRTSAASAAYRTAERTFFAHFQTPLAAQAAAHPASQATYWLKNTPASVLDVVIAASDASLPPAQLYCFAATEGVIDYVRDVIGLGDTGDPTVAQLAGVNTAIGLSGYGYLGTDDFWLDLHAKREPLTAGYLPAGYDLSKLAHEPAINEQGRTVDSVKFPDLTTGMQALAAILKRRRALFLADAAALGYGTPTTEELMYWTYVYYNVGEFNGQLKKYQGARKLSDWITRREYPNAMKLLESYRMVEAMAIF